VIPLDVYLASPRGSDGSVNAACERVCPAVLTEPNELWHNSQLKMGSSSNPFPTQDAMQVGNFYRCMSTDAKELFLLMPSALCPPADDSESIRCTGFLCAEAR
jgi:hypothetical protein